MHVRTTSTGIEPCTLPHSRSRPLVTLSCHATQQVQTTFHPQLSRPRASTKGARMPTSVTRKQKRPYQSSSPCPACHCKAGKDTASIPCPTVTDHLCQRGKLPHKGRNATAPLGLCMTPSHNTFTALIRSDNVNVSTYVRTYVR